MCHKEQTMLSIETLLIIYNYLLIQLGNKTCNMILFWQKTEVS